MHDSNSTHRLRYILLYSDHSMARDFYEVLGIARTATADEVRRAYRKLAKEFHPDKNKAAEATKRFSEVQEAYDTLSEAEKRRQYDQFGRAGAGFGAQGGGQGGGPWQNVNQSDLEEMLGGLGGIGDFFRTGASPRPRSGPTRSARGQDSQQEVTVDFMTAAVGGSRNISTRDAAGKIESIDVRIPAGISSGGVLRVPGKGSLGIGGGPQGDLMVVVRIAPHPWFYRDGMDVSINVPITIVEAALGTSVGVPLLKGSITLRIPPGTHSGKKLRVTGKGIAPVGKTPGDFYAVIDIVAPTSLDPTDAASLTTLGTKLPDPREHRWE